MRTSRGHVGAVAIQAVVLGLVAHLIGLGTATAGPTPAGQTFTVTNLSDGGPGSLRAAIDAANASPGAATIRFAPGLKGTILLGSVLSITDDVTIGGPGAKKVTVSGNDVTRVFSISGAGINVEIDDLTITHGSVSAPGGIALGGGLLNDGASVRLSNVILSENQATGLQAGGGAVATVGGSFTAVHTDFLDNTVHSADGQLAFGGALYAEQGAVVSLDHATFSDNVVHGGVANGGAIGATGGSQVTIDHGSFAGNTADGGANDGAFGGAVVAQALGLITSDPTTVTIAHSSFTGNQALARTADAGADANGQGDGGAIDLEDGSTVNVSSSTFDGNRARAGDGGAGGAGSAGGTGGASFGGAISNLSGTLVVSHSRFTSNEVRAGNGGQGGAGGDGGEGNFAIGGAVAASALISTGTPPTTQIDHSSFVGNHAFGGAGGAGGAGGSGGAGSRADGGGIDNLIGTITISDSSIANNTALGGPGGAPGSGAGTVGGDGGLSRSAGFANERGGTAAVSRTPCPGWRSAAGSAGRSARTTAAASSPSSPRRGSPPWRTPRRCTSRACARICSTSSPPSRSRRCATSARP